ncbi:MAG: hypothetical protein OEZ16_02160 [Chromatiales bacterium]|nr:hypothetical protein [Chromatiales bacterium]
MSDDNANNLLSALKCLYGLVTRKILTIRFSSHNSFAAGVTTESLFSDLDDYIGTLCNSCITNTEQKKETTSSVAETHSDDDTKYRGDQHHNTPHAHPLSPGPTTNHSDGLSSYFQHHHATTTLQPDISNRLCASAWHHIHMAINYARQGDNTSAQMHSSLAKNAIHMAAEFMDDEDFLKFRCELDRCREGLSSLRQ